METEIITRKVTQDVLLLVWFKKEIITNDPSPELCFLPEISAQLIENLSISVWVESFRSEIFWKDFVNKHFKRMTSSPYLFTNYVAYIFYILDKNTDAYECFFDTFSIVTFFGLYCWKRERKQFINACAELFCTFFQQNIRMKFESKGGWKHFNEYLEKHNNLKKYRLLLSENVSPLEYFETLRNELGHVNELNYSINDVFIKNISRKHVETDERAVSFAKSVEDALRELCKKGFKEILEDFTKADYQVKAMYRQMFGESSVGMAAEEEKFSLPKIQKEASENIPSTYKPEKKEQQKQTVIASGILEIQNLDNINSQGTDTSGKGLHSQKSRQLERVENFLRDMSTGLAQLSNIIDSLYQEYGK
ncbi:unnamed protein product [Larinioides sclopetarius]|uniref:Uncharacterized protein n=1 Tax=Larinioides sclopetarius TaxID=280406 RepID=A0AAV2BRR6_9ARAC